MPDSKSIRGLHFAVRLRVVSRYLGQAFLLLAALTCVPAVVAGASGRVTVCLYAEPLYAAVSNAAFFDDAVLTVGP